MTSEPSNPAPVPTNSPVQRNDEAQPDKKLPQWVEFLWRHPAVVIAGTLSSIFSFLCALYFYFAGVRVPDLICFIHPVRTEIVRAGIFSGITVSHNGTSLTGDVTAVQVHLWNNGKQPIHSENILKPIVLKTDQGNPILEATIVKTSRDVSGFALITTNIDKGEVITNWRILERNDGGVIQLIYAGSPKVRIHAQGIIEDQGVIMERQMALRLDSTAKEQLQTQRGLELLALLLACMTFLLGCRSLSIAWKNHKQLKEGEKKGHATDNLRDAIMAKVFGSGTVSGAVVNFSFAVTFLCLAVYIFYLTRIPVSPFGF